MNTKVEFYRDHRGDHRWRIIAAENGEILATSSQGYNRRSDAETAAHRVVFGAQRGDTIHLTTSRTIQPEPDYTALVGGIAEGVHDDEDGAA